MKLTAAHRTLIRILAEAAVEQFVEEQHQEEPMREHDKGESNAPCRTHSD